MTLSLLLAAAAAVAQPAQTVPLPPVPERPAAGPPGQPFMSPMGEPFLGKPGGVDGLTVWFQQADRNHDGAITQDEMIADAQRFFETLDTNHDGEIDPDETTHYEQVIAPEVRTGLILASQSASADNQQGRGSRGQGGRHGSRRFSDFAGSFGGDDEARAGRFGLLQIPEPITSADANFDRGVSVQEFRTAAIQRFNLLDINHTGRLTLPELQDIHGAAKAAFKRQQSKDEADQAPQLDPQADTDGSIPQM